MMDGDVALARDKQASTYQDNRPAYLLNWCNKHVARSRPQYWAKITHIGHKYYYDYYYRA